MRSVRWLLLIGALLACAAVAVVATGAWAYAHRGYGDVVYYQRLVVAGSASGAFPGYVLEEWIDPRRGFVRKVTSGGGLTAVIVQRDGRDYAETRGTVGDAGGQSPSEARQIRTHSKELLYGFRGLAHGMLARARGLVTRTSIFGIAAIRFETTDPEFVEGRARVWLDARSLQVLQIAGPVGDASFAPIRFAASAILEPGTLPSTFFDPPGGRVSVWERITGWLEGRTGPGRTGGEHG